MNRKEIFYQSEKLPAKTELYNVQLLIETVRTDTTFTTTCDLCPTVILQPSQAIVEVRECGDVIHRYITAQQK